MGTYIIAGLIIWYLIGLYSFYYWWTKDEDLTTDSEILWLWFGSGFLGLVVYFIGKNIEDGEKPIKHRIIFKKRN